MEREVIRSGLRNSLMSIIAQLVNFLLGLAKVLVLPIILGVSGFGYWHVYLLYVSYLGLLSLGFNDGIYLRYGKFDYADMPKPVLRSSIRLFIIMQLIMMGIAFFAVRFEPDPGKQVSLFWVVINIPIAGLSGILIHVLQVTNQLKKFILYSVIDKIILFVFIIIFLITNTDNYLLVIAIDTFSKLIVLGLMAYECNELFIGASDKLRSAYFEFRENISVGSKLMIASLTGMLVFGFGRFVVERFDSVAAYGTYSFAISTTNLVLIFMTAIGVVVYPTMNRLDEKKYSTYFTKIDKILSILVFGLLIIYFPLRLFIIEFLPDYIPIFEYLPVIFSVIFIQSKMQILINPYFKLLREEKEMLKANLLGLISAIIIIVPLYLFYGSVLSVAIGTVLAMSIRYLFSDIILRNRLSIQVKHNVLIDFAGVLTFIFLAFQSNRLFGFLAWLIVYGFYLVFRYRFISKYLSVVMRDEVL